MLNTLKTVCMPTGTSFYAFKETPCYIIMIRIGIKVLILLTLTHYIGIKIYYWAETHL